MGLPCPAQVSSSDSCGAQNTSSPADMEHSSTVVSEPPQVNSDTCGGTAPHVSLDVQLAKPADPEYPICLQATEAEPLVKPSLHTAAHTCEAARNISSRPASPGRAGAPAPPTRRSSPSENAFKEVMPQKTMASLLWLRHESSTSSELHSSTLSSAPEHFKFFTATGDPTAPHQLKPPYLAHGDGLKTPKS